MCAANTTSTEPSAGGRRCASATPADTLVADRLVASSSIPGDRSSTTAVPGLVESSSKYGPPEPHPTSATVIRPADMIQDPDVEPCGTVRGGLQVGVDTHPGPKVGAILVCAAKTPALSPAPDLGLPGPSQFSRHETSSCQSLQRADPTCSVPNSSARPPNIAARFTPPMGPFQDANARVVGVKCIPYRSSTPSLNDANRIDSEPRLRDRHSGYAPRPVPCCGKRETAQHFRAWTKPFGGGGKLEQ